MKKKTKKTSVKKTAVKPTIKPVGEVLVIMTGYGHEAGAAMAADQFKRPEVFRYQSAYFPNPDSYKVAVRILQAVPVKLKESNNPLYPWGVELSMNVDGIDKNVQNWITDFRGRIRAISI